MKVCVTSSNGSLTIFNFVFMSAVIIPLDHHGPPLDAHGQPLDPAKASEKDQEKLNGIIVDDVRPTLPQAGGILIRCI